MSHTLPANAGIETVQEIVADIRSSKEGGEHAVYVLECVPEPAAGTDLKRLAERWFAEDALSDKLDEAIDNAIEADQVFYVGETTNVVLRILDHVWRSPRAANFTVLFPPQSIYDIEWYIDRDEAQEREEEWATELTNVIYKGNSLVDVDEDEMDWRYAYFA